MANTKRVQFRRGTKAEHELFTGASAEITVNTTNNSIHVHDGVTPEGYESARIDFSNVQDASASGNIDIVGIASIGSGLNVTGISTFGGDLTISGDLSLFGNKTILISDLDVDGDTNVTGIASFGNDVVISGLTTANSDVDINANLYVQDQTILNNVSVTGVTTFSNNVSVTGLTTFSNNVNVIATLTTGSLNITGVTSVSGDTVISGVTTINNELNANAGLNVNSDLNVTGFSTLTNLRVVGISTIEGFVGFSSDVEIYGTTNLYDQLTVDANVGVGSLNVLGVSTIGGRLNVEDDVEISNNLYVSGLTTSVGSFEALDTSILTGNVDIRNDVKVAGVSSFSGTVYAETNVAITGDLSVDNDALFAGISTFGANNGIGTVTVGLGSTALYVDGTARIKERLSVGSSTIVIDGTNNTISIGTNFTLKPTGDINTSGIITANTLSSFEAELENLIVSGIATISGLKFPNSDGLKGQVLTTDGEGNIGFATGGSGGGSDARILVSSANGDDANDGRTLPVKTIKRAAQLASFRGFKPMPGRFLDAANLLSSNKAFIQEEVVAYLEFNYPNLTVDKPDYSPFICKRDIGFILDAIIYDIRYGGNSRSVEAGLAYWDGSTSYVAGETEETLFAYDYIRFIGQYIINNQTPPTLYQTRKSQVFDFSLIYDRANSDDKLFNRRKDARNLIVGNRQEIIDKSLASVAVGFPDFFFPGEQQTNSRSRFYDSYRLIQQNKKEITEKALASVAVQYPDFFFPGDDQTNNRSRFYDSYRLIQLNKTEIVNTAWIATASQYGGIVGTETKCKRDLGYFVDAISTDIFTGGNYYSREFVLQYFDGSTFISNGLEGESEESNYAFNQARDLMKDAITNQLTVKDLTITADPITQNNESPNSCSDVRTNIDNLVSIVTTVIGAGNTSSLPIVNNGVLTAGGSKCLRDLGYFVDSVSTDIFTGGNNYSRQFVLKYFDGATFIANGLAGEAAQSNYAFQSASDLMKRAITNQLNVKDLTVTADSVTGFNTDPSSCANVQTNIQNLVGIVTSVVAAASTSGLPSANLGYFVVNSVTNVNDDVGIGTTAVGGRKCARDLGYIVDAIAQDVSYGSNQHIVYATKKYFDGVGIALTTGLFGEEAQSAYAFETAKSLTKQAITNQLFFQDYTILPDPITGINSSPLSCANIQATVETLYDILITAVESGSLSLVPASNLGTTDCANVRSAIVSSIGIVTTIVGLGSTAAPAVTQPVRFATNNTTIFVEAGEYVEDNPIILYENITINGDSLRNAVVRPLNAKKDVFRVRNGIFLANFAIKDYVDEFGKPIHTFDYSVAYDDPFDPAVSRVGYAGSEINIVGAQYDTSTGITTIITAGDHNFIVGNSIRLSGLGFTCGYDEVGINTFAYTNTTGIATVVAFAPHGYEINDKIFLYNLPFSCSVEHAGITTTIFPDGTGLGRVFTVTGVNTTTKSLTVNVGISTIPHVFEGWPEVGISTFAYTNTTGIATAVTSSPNNYRVGDKITLAGLAFTCDSGSGITTTIFPDGTITAASYDGYTFTVTGVNTGANSFTYNAGISTIKHYYVSGGTTKKVPTFQRVWEYPERLSSGTKDFGVIKVDDPESFVVQAEPFSNNPFPHYYAQGGTAKTGLSIIVRSPYIQNCSIISFLGGNGILVDGDKVIDANIPAIREEAENPVEGPQPTQGKSMVAATFTMVSFGGIGWRTINDGYAQVVSCFQIFCKYGSLTQSGGYLSITNSATNFGDFALRSTGFSRKSFVFDRGRISATGVSGGLQTLKVVGLGRSDQDLYVLRFFNDQLQDRTSDFKPIVISQQFEVSTGVNTATDTITILSHPFNNLDSVVYFGNEDSNPKLVIDGLVTGNVYYVKFINSDNIQLYEDEGLSTLADLNSTFVGINTLTKNNQEFIVQEIISTHNSYQLIGLASSTLNFVSGRTVTQVTSNGTATGIAVTFSPETRQLLVSVEEVSEIRNNFAITGGSNLNILDHSGSPVSVAITEISSDSSYYTIEFKVDSTIPGNVISGVSNLPEQFRCHFHRPSIINASAHTWEYSGSGTDYNALPQNGGKTITSSEQVSELGGRVFASGTNELGDFKIGNSITAFNRTGNIIFNNKVSIGQLDSLRLSLSGGVSVESFSTDINLGDSELGGPKNERVSTQLAVRSFLNNRLGDFIDKRVTTSAIPNSVVQLNAAGQINADLIPPKVVNFTRTNIGGGRTTIVNYIPAANILSGDTVVEPENSFVLINDVYSQFLILNNSSVYNFQNGDEVVSTISNGSAIGIVTVPTNTVGYGTTGLVRGVALTLKNLNGGAGYAAPGIYTGVSLNSSTGIGTNITATITVGVAGTVTNIGINTGGRYYAVNDTLTLTNANLIGGRGVGSDFTVQIATVETRLYIALSNNQKFAGSIVLPDYIADRNAVSISTSLTSGISSTFIPTDISIAGSVDFLNNRIILGSGVSFTDGDPAIYSNGGGNAIGGLLNNQTYYIKNVGSGSSISLYTNYSLVSIVELTGSGTGIHSLTRVAINTSTESIVVVSHNLTTGSAVRVSGNTPTGIDTGSFYYSGSITPNSFTLHTSRSDSLASVNGLVLNPVNLLEANTGICTFRIQNVTYDQTINTSSSLIDNWALLAQSDIDATNIVSGTVSPSRLGSGSATADTFLAGDSSYKRVIKSVGIGTTQPIQVLATSSQNAPGGVGVNTYFGDLQISLNRVSTTVDTFSTLGVSKFKTSTFSIGADGEVSIKNSVTGDIDASTLGNQSGSYYLDLANSTGSLGINRGGTNSAATPTAGAIAYGSGTSYQFSAAGSSGQILRSAGGSAPTWSTATYPAITIANRLLYSSSNNVIGELTSANTAVLITNNTGIPSFLSGTTGSRVLRTDGTTISFAQLALSTDVTGILGLSNGGTNANLTAVNGGVVWSNATQLQITSAGTSGQALVSNGAAAPTFQTLTLENLPQSTFKRSVRVATPVALARITYGTNTISVNTAKATFSSVNLNSININGHGFVTGTAVYLRPDSQVTNTFSVGGAVQTTTNTTLRYIRVTDANNFTIYDTLSNAINTSTTAGQQTLAIVGTVTVTIEMPIAIDAVVLTTNDRVLIKNETASQRNGIYTVTNATLTAWTLTRSADADANNEIGSGVVAVDQGERNSGDLYTTPFSTTATLNTTAMPWVEIIGHTQNSLSKITPGGISYASSDNTLAITSAGLSGQLLVSGGAGAPTWSAVTYPSTTTVNRILYSSATNVIGEIVSANTAALVTNSTGVPSFVSGTTANRVLRTDGTTISFAQVALTTDVTGILPLANGGTNASLTASNGGIVWSNATQLQILAGNATAGRILRSGASASPSWSTATFPNTATNANRFLRADGANWVESTSTIPDTFAINSLVYASAANVLSALAPVNDRLLATSATGVPTWSLINFRSFAPDEPYKSSVRVATVANVDYGVSSVATTSGGIINGYSQTTSLSATSGAGSNILTFASTATIRLNATITTPTIQIPAGLTVSSVNSATQVSLNLATRSIAITGITGSGSVVTVTYGAQTLIPFAVGAVIVIAGAAPYNGTFTVASCTTTQVTYSSIVTGAATLVTPTISQTIAAGTSTPTLTNVISALSIDGVVLALNDRVLFKDMSLIAGLFNNTAPAYNGIYTVTATGSTVAPWQLTRAVDANTSARLNSAVVNVNQGTANGGKTYLTSYPSTGTLNTTLSLWTRAANVLSSFQSGAPITLSGVDFVSDQETVRYTGGAVANYVANSLGIKTIQTTTASTYTTASTLYIAGAPAASTNLTITSDQRYSLFIGANAGGVVRTDMPWNAANNRSQIWLNGATGNRIEWNTAGVAAPAFTTRSAGTKLVLFPGVAATAVDYALGIESSTLWSSIPQNVNTNFFRWYGGQTNIATLTGTGNLYINGQFTRGSGAVSSFGDVAPTVDASLTDFVSWDASFTTNRTMTINNFTPGRRVTVYIRNTNATARTLTVQCRQDASSAVQNPSLTIAGTGTPTAPIIAQRSFGITNTAATFVIHSPSTAAYRGYMA